MDRLDKRTQSQDKRTQTGLSSLFLALSSFSFIAAFLFRMVVGITFLVSGFAKLLLPPEEFIQVLHSYQVIPEVLFSPLTILLPGIELLSGSCLILGFFTRAASIVILIQLGSFIALMSVVIFSGIELKECGCFGSLGIQETPEQVIIRDAILLIMALVLFITNKHRYALDNLFDGSD